MQKLIILARVLGRSKEYVLAHPEARLTPLQHSKYKRALKKLAAGYPLGYIIKQRWFCNLPFFVNENVLIPRPETEMLVATALEHVRDSKPKIICDVGTGSGAIIISLRKEIRYKGAQCFATDISQKSLAVARKNLKLLKAAPISFKRGNLLAPVQKRLRGAENVMIVANLPYLSKKELAEKTIKHEPRLALYGGRNPLNKISKLLRQIKKLRLSRSKIILEINYNQGEQIAKLAAKLFPKSAISIKKDSAGFNRIADITI